MALSAAKIGYMTKIKGRCVLVTGGASGIGRIMGSMALERGARHLVVWDINEADGAALGAEAGRPSEVARTGAAGGGAPRRRGRDSGG